MGLERFYRHKVIGVRVSAMDYASACEAITDAAAAKQALTVTALAVHGVMTGVLSRQHRYRLNALDMVLPDGQPVRWALNLLFRTNLRDRVYGPNLMLRICERAEMLGLSVGLYGNRPEVLEDLRLQLLTRFPRLRLAAVMPSRFARVSPDEQAELARRIAASGVDLLFVGLGCPRQEIWLYENRSQLDMPLIAVGAAFDFHAKRLSQAPGWMQDCGLEWLFRLWHEPRRLWRRYVLLNPLFLSLLALQFLGQLLTGRVESGESVQYEGYA
jgi:N-acetylglucosaminyldiphosphoundecaprenol N-acetyl-beta-D-mannosaminyltransferase